MMQRFHSEKFLTEPDICSGESAPGTVFSALTGSDSTMTSRPATQAWLVSMCRVPGKAKPSKLSQNSRRHKPAQRETSDLVGAREISQTK